MRASNLNAYTPLYEQLRALDVRSGGESRAPISPDYGWNSYTADHLALIDHLGITRCHVFGACIGVSFAFSLVQARPRLVSAVVAQNAVGGANNCATVMAEVQQWVEEISTWPGVDPAMAAQVGQRMFGGDFLFSITREFIATCTMPVLLMPGNDEMHPAETTADLVRLLPRIEVLDPWKGLRHRDAAMQRVLQFCLEHTPKD
jgi:pimeloyl-ACP methyl ester carboxylesterase